MRKWRIICVLMIILALVGCREGTGTQTGNKTEELALSIRGEYLAAREWSGIFHLTADYGQRVYEFELAMAGREKETVVVVTAPEEVAGISVTLSQGGSLLEVDGTLLETGDLGGEVTPLTAGEALMEAARSGFMATCTLEEDGTLLRVDCRPPDSTPGTGQEIVLWFDVETHALVAGEISQDGRRVLTCQVSEFTIIENGEIPNGDATEENLGGG